MEEYQNLLQVMTMMIMIVIMIVMIIIIILMQVKTALDMEIAVYKQLLETEEDRLGITPEQGLSKCHLTYRELSDNPCYSR